MYRRLIGVMAGLLASASAGAQGLPATAKDVASVIESHATDRSYPNPLVVAWERDLRAGLAHRSSERGSVERAADGIAAKYGFSQAEMRELANAWIVAQARHYEMRDERGWKPKVRADLLALLPAVRHHPLGLMIAAETLDAIDDCSAGDFDALVKGSADPAADAYLVASAAACSDNFARAALVAPDRSMPALIRMANWGGLPPRDTLPLYAWLTSPAVLARISAADRPALSAILWQRYLEVLLKAGLTARALALLDAMPAETRARVLAAHDVPVGTAMVDGIAMSFSGEGGSLTIRPPASASADALEEAAEMLDDAAGVVDAAAGTKAPKPRAHDKPEAQGAVGAAPVVVAARSTAPIPQVALALMVANRGAEARALLDTLPGLAAARAAAHCLYQREDRKQDSCPNSNELPMDTLILDHLLYHDGEDPYPIAETVLVGSYSSDTLAGAEIRCRVFAADQFPGICANARKAALAEARLDEGSDRDEAVHGEAALLRVVPGFVALRDGFVAEATAIQGGAAPAAPSWRRDTVAAVTPGFAEHPLSGMEQGAGALPMPKGLAPLPEGFELVRAERSGQRAIAISVSQTFDPTGEVSRGGYWVHLSEDGGAHWQKPLYTGLAERFPYVVAARSRLPLQSGDTVNLAVDVAEIDTASISYPPVGLRTLRRQTGLYLEIPLADLRRDSDGDGLSDVAAHHLLLDHARTDGGTPFVVGSDRSAACDAPPPREREARIAVLGKLFDPAGAAIVEPTDRPAGQITGNWQHTGAAADQPLFLLGDPRDYGCLRPTRPMIVYGKDDIAAIKRFTPDFHAVELPPIVFNRAHDRGYVAWSTGWAGGTYRLRLIEGRWVFDTLSSWIT